MSSTGNIYSIGVIFSIDIGNDQCILTRWSYGQQDTKYREFVFRLSDNKILISYE